MVGPVVVLFPAAVWFGADTDGEVDTFASSTAFAFGSSSISLLEYDLGEGECAVLSELSGDSDCFGLETGVNAMDVFCGSFFCSGWGCGCCCLGEAGAVGWFVSVDRVVSVDGVGVVPFCFNV